MSKRDDKALLWELRVFAAFCVACGVWSACEGHWNDPSIGFGLLFVVYYSVAAGVWLWRRLRRAT